MGGKEVLDVYGKDVPFLCPVYLPKEFCRGGGEGRGLKISNELNCHL